MLSPVLTSTGFFTDLRARTRAAHMHVEQRLALPDATRSWGRYRALLCTYYSFLLPFEWSLARFPWDEIGIVFADRRRTHLIAADLQFLDVPVHAIDIGAPDWLPADFDGAIGALYAIESLTLSGTIAARFVVERLGSEASACIQFLTGFGPDSPTMWRQLCQSIARRAIEWDTADHIVAGALGAYHAIDATLAAREWHPRASVTDL